MTKITAYAKIGIMLFISFFVSQFLTSEIFIYSTPRVRQDMKQYLATRFSEITNVKTLVARLFNGANTSDVQITEKQQEAHQKMISQSLQELEKVAFKDIAVGVKAKQNGSVSQTTYEIDKIKWIEYKYTRKNGEVITIRVPEGQNPPPQGAL